MAATTLGNAVFNSDSDPEDADFAASEGGNSEGDADEESDGQDEALDQAERRRRRKQRAAKKKRAAAKGLAEKAAKEAEAAYEELLDEEQRLRARSKKHSARARLAPCEVLSSPLWTVFHRRHAPPKPDRSKKGLLDMLRRYSCGISLATDEESVQNLEQTAPKTLKRKIRGEVLPAPPPEEEGEPPAAARLQPEALVEERISYAGEEHVVLRAASQVPAASGKRAVARAPAPAPAAAAAAAAAPPAASAAPAAASPASNSSAGMPAGPPAAPKRKAAGQLAGLDELLAQTQKARKISTVEKTGLDWQAYKDAHGLHSTDLKKDQSYGGAIERKEFLSRTAQRGKAAQRAEARATSRFEHAAKAAAKAGAGPGQQR